jgi:hypothetical protein
LKVVPPFKSGGGNSQKNIILFNFTSSDGRMKGEGIGYNSCNLKRTGWSSSFPLSLLHHLPKFLGIL